MARWTAVVMVLAVSAWAVEVEDTAQTEEGPHLRTFIGGFTSGAYVAAVNGGSFSAGPAGIAGDFGLQLDSRFSLSVQLRASTWIISNHLQIAPSFEWSPGLVSVALGAGGAVLFSFPASGATFSPALTVPLVIGLTLGERRAEMGLRSVRINLELALLVIPGPLGLGGSIGISVGSQTR